MIQTSLRLEDEGIEFSIFEPLEEETRKVSFLVQVVEKNLIVVTFSL